MAKASDQFDIWLLAADTVYRGVPLGVVQDWAIQGRIAAADRIRPAGSTAAWMNFADHPRFADFLFRSGKPAPEGPASYAEQLEPIEMDPVLSSHEEEDDDPDMIPLIDISLVLLVFFMMTTAVAALSPVDVPDLKHVGGGTDKDAIVIQVDKRADGTVYLAVRVGEKPPLADNNNLPTIEAALDRLDLLLTTAQRPPEVRIACNKDLERSWVREIAGELDKRQVKGQISFYGAEVNKKASDS